MVTAGVASSGLAQHVKEGTLNFNLKQDYQALVTTNGTAVSAQAFPMSWPTIQNCSGYVNYKNKVKYIKNKEIIQAISWTLSSATDDPSSTAFRTLGLFTTKATLAIYNYDNRLLAPPYPPYMSSELAEQNGGFLYMPLEAIDWPDMQGGIYNPLWFYDRETYPQWPEWTFPWNFQKTWPDENKIRWNYIMDDCVESPTPTHMVRIFVKDPTNPQPGLRCVEVTPFFEIEEAYCHFCWDTMDRVTVGKITAGTTAKTDYEVCVRSITTVTCGRSGKGTTKWYSTVKFNNTSDNAWITRFYLTQWEQFVIGPDLSPNAPGVAYAMWFTVNGIVTYPWSYKALAKNEGLDVFGTMSMSSASGYGAAPFCGVISGSVSIPEKSILEEDCCGCQVIGD